MTTSRFDLSYARSLLPLFSLLGMGPGRSGVEVTPDLVRVRMGWSFTADIPRTTITSSAPDFAPVLGWGVHGFGGRWLVNGSSVGLVRLAMHPPAAAQVLGVSVRLRVLRLSMTDPHGLLAALAHPV